MMGDMATTRLLLDLGVVSSKVEGRSTNCLLKRIYLMTWKLWKCGSTHKFKEAGQTFPEKAYCS